jgi:hypothetical protein
MALGYPACPEPYGLSDGTDARQLTNRNPEDKMYPEMFLDLQSFNWGSVKNTHTHAPKLPQASNSLQTR